MSWERIMDFSLDAVAFALPLGFLFFVGIMIVRKASLRRRDAVLTLFVTYLAALLKITALRQAGLSAVFETHSMSSIQLLPLIYTIQELGNGLWAFLYPVLGNIIWFVPMGFFLPWLWRGIRKRTVLLIAAMSSLSIEFCQWLLQSGVSDIDDVIFNSLGALVGYWLFVAIFQNLCYAVRKEMSEK